MGSDGLMQIGEVAERTCLSPRTIRYYEEVELVVPSARSQGGFRLYTEGDVRRLWLIRRLKPLDLTLEQIRELLAALEKARVESLTPGEAEGVKSTLVAFQAIARTRCEVLREQLVDTEEFSADLTGRIGALDK